MLDFSWYLSVWYFCILWADQITALLLLSAWAWFITFFTRYSSLRPRCFIINYTLIVIRFVHFCRYIFLLNLNHFPSFSLLRLKTNKLFLSIILRILPLLMVMFSLLLGTVLWDNYIIKWIFSSLSLCSRCILGNGLLNEIIKFFVFFFICLEPTRIASLCSLLDYF